MFENEEEMYQIFFNYKFLDPKKSVFREITFLEKLNSIHVFPPFFLLFW